MKELTGFLIGFLFTTAVSAQSMIDSLNTGKDATYMNSYERSVLYEINHFRSGPAQHMKLLDPYIESLREKVKRGEKQKAYYTTIHDNGKTDTTWYDFNERELRGYELFKKMFETQTALPPLKTDEGFWKATDAKDAKVKSGEYVNGYHILAIELEWYTSSPGQTGQGLLPGSLYSSSSEKLDSGALNYVLSKDKNLLVAVHERNERDAPLFPSSPIHFYVAFGNKVGTASLLSNNPIKDYTNPTIEFAESTADGIILGGGSSVIKATPQGDVVWRNSPAAKGSYEIKSHAMLSDGSIVLGGWKKISGKNNLWLYKVDKSGNTVWEKGFPVKDGNILALAEDKNGKGVWAVVSEYETKKMFKQTLRLFDNSGAEVAKYFMLAASENLKMGTSYQDDVSLFHLGGEKFYVFGVDIFNTFTGDYFEKFEEKETLSHITNILVESAVDLGYSDFVTIQKPEGGFYVSCEDNSDERKEDYRLFAVSDDLYPGWSKLLGGDLSEGPSSMVMDKDGNLILAGFSYSGVSGDKSEPAFEKDHCDVWVIKVDRDGNKLWDKTITGPGCIQNARIFLQGDKTGVVFSEGVETRIAMIGEK